MRHALCQRLTDGTSSSYFVLVVCRVLSLRWLSQYGNGINKNSMGFIRVSLHQIDQYKALKKKVWWLRCHYHHCYRSSQQLVSALSPRKSSILYTSVEVRQSWEGKPGVLTLIHKASCDPHRGPFSKAVIPCYRPTFYFFWTLTWP